MMPAFSTAISARLFPSSWVWSRLMGVITETRGETTFTASSRPPSPTSSTTISGRCFAKWSMAAAVATS